MKKRIINEIRRVEGGHVNDPDDSGGETNFGITLAVARANGYTGRIDHMPRSVAFEIYATSYWDAVSADDLVKLSELVAEEVVDTAVNMGPARAGTILQRALNVLNRREKLYRDLKVDGLVGVATISALRCYLAERNELVLTRALDCLQGAYYIDLAERREKDERFVYGWLKKRITV